MVNKYGTPIGKFERGGLNLNTLVQGKHQCYVCQSEITWEANLNGRTATYGINPPIAGFATAIGRETLEGDVGMRLVLEVIVPCKTCETRNKFTHVHDLTDKGSSI